jgi:LacI family repressor for deo operon, udp, cdd, tsx, nupC, and nupG
VHVLDSGALSVIQAFLTSNREITAVICSDDYVAIELYYAAVGVGLRVPRDLSITGFCDNRVLRFLPIRLSTVSQPVDAMGKQAVACLLSRMNDPEREYCEIVIGTEIVDRDTIRDISDGISTMSE